MKKRLAKVSIFESVGGNVIDDGCIWTLFVLSLVQTDGDNVTVSDNLTMSDNITFSYNITNNNLMTVGYLLTGSRNL
ncbi:hypothetical protein [Methanobacterium sp. BAmetb5]|uniref:hypothetical protein n=1 Tax=Methanobacterium sp. BAmetb5 TaxID=2025351 RepID=UPI0025FC11B9|nr:hypothetical protein [Methanobacterium sp. BAmetb5]